MRGCLLLCLLSTAAVAEDLSVSVTPAWLQLGVDRTALVELQGPPDLKDVSVLVSHGRVGLPRQLAPGRFTVDYTAPGQTFPRVAIVAVRATSARRPVHGWARLPLWGSAQAGVLTAPFQSISLQIGQRTFGPVKADAQGRATVAVVVPPGVREARFGTKGLDLGLPRVALTLLVLEAPQLRGDRAQTQQARLYAVTADGTPRENLELTARAGRGTVGRFVAEGKGVYVARWELPPGDPGDLELSAWPSSEPNEFATAHLQVLGGAPALLELSVDRSEHRAGESGEFQLQARVLDGAGHLTAGTPALSSSLGVIGSLVSAGEGTWRATLRLPDSFGGATSASVRARLGGVPDAQVELTLEPGAPKSLRVVPERLTLSGDGQGRAEIQVGLFDAWGNPLEAPLEATSSAGRLERLSGSRYRYVAPRLRGGGEATLELGAGELHATLPVALTAAPSRLTLAPKLGFLTNFGNANAPTIAAELTLWPSERLGAGLEVGYFFLPRETEVSAGSIAGTRADFSVHGVPVLASFAWRTRVGSLRVGATAAGGMAVTSAAIALASQQRVTETSLAVVARLAASAGVPLGDGAAFLELSGGWLGLPTSSLVVSGPLFSLGLNVGYRFELL